MAEPRKRLAHQRRELKRLNHLLHTKRYERFGKRVFETVQSLRDLERRLSQLLADDHWNAGWRFGLRVARDLALSRMSAADGEWLKDEVEWRITGKRPK